MNESSIYAKLEVFREQFIAGELKPCIDVKLKLGEHLFTQNVWVEPHEKGELVVIMLGSEKCLNSNKYCLGLTTAKDGSVEYLTNEQLWDIGIP
ncbi:hypothetical protein [Thalassomonas haliotis]|uniref:Uncharacterized protein n=1 Tax=Thalassomonas haliotis TaxID=485448 RepID=A0ABY7V9V2_9GAMM|nr:hypothetical protein [Thalassomonas haliotis]WDE10397.1 hypothetical protein H3N35_19270 [Thalassomonas haliotis]